MSKAHQKRLAAWKEMYADQIQLDRNNRYDRDITISGEGVYNIIQEMLIKGILESQMMVKQSPALPDPGLVFLAEETPSAAKHVEEEPKKIRTQVCPL